MALFEAHLEVERTVDAILLRPEDGSQVLRHRRAPHALSWLARCAGVGVRKV